MGISLFFFTNVSLSLFSQRIRGESNSIHIFDQKKKKKKKKCSFLPSDFIVCLFCKIFTCVGARHSLSPIYCLVFRYLFIYLFTYFFFISHSTLLKHANCATLNSSLNVNNTGSNVLFRGLVKCGCENVTGSIEVNHNS